MAYEAGTAFMQVFPSFQGFVSACSDEAQKAGDVAGQIFSDTWAEVVRSGTSDTQVGPSDSSSAKQGESSGGKFADAFRLRIDAALKALPDVNINADSTAADLKIEEIRTRLETLRNLKIGVDISDTDALLAIGVLKVDLDELARKSPSIRVSVDAAAAIAELEAVKLAADDASGSGASGGGLSGLFSSMGSVGGEMGSMIPIIGLLGTALIPVGAAAVGVGLGFTGMATAAVVGVGAFGLAALPVFMSVSKAMQQITADQNAVNRATSTAQKNTAITHLNDDLKNLSPTVAGITLGVLDLKTAFMNWDAQFNPDILNVFNAAAKAVGPILDAITPLVHAGAKAMTEFFTAISQTAQQSDFKTFMSWLATQVGPAIEALQKTFDNFSGGMSKMLEHSGGLIKIVEDGMVSLSAQFEKMAESKAFQNFVDYIIQNGPAVGKFFEDTIGAVGHLITAFAPIGKTVLDALDGVALAIKGISPDVILAIAGAFGIWALAASPLTLLAGAILGVGLAVHALSTASATLTDQQIIDANKALSVLTQVGPPTPDQTGVLLRNSAALKAAYDRGLTDQQIKDAGSALTQIGPPTPTQSSALNTAKNANTNQHLADLKQWAEDTKKVVTQAYLWLFEGIGKMSGWLTAAYKDVQNWARDVPIAFGTAFHAVHDITNTVWHTIDNDVFHPIADFFTQTIPHALSVTSGAFTDGFQAIHNIVNTVWHAIDNDFVHPIEDFFTQTIPHILDAAVGFFEALPGRVNHVWSDVVNALQGAWSTVSSWVNSNVIQPVVQFFEGIPGFISHVWSDVVSGIQGAWSAISSWVSSNVIDPVVHFFTDMPSNIGNALSGLAGIIEGPFKAAEGFIGTIVGHIEGWLGDIGIHIGNTSSKIAGLQQQANAATNAINLMLPSGIPTHALGTGMGTFQGTTWVGERGPELVNFGSPVQIIPNSAINSPVPIDLSGTTANSDVVAELRGLAAILRAAPANTGAAMGVVVNRGDLRVMETLTDGLSGNRLR